MIDQEKYRRLKQIIQDSNPEIMKLKFGCQIQILSDPRKDVYTIVETDVQGNPQIDGSMMLRVIRADQKGGYRCVTTKDIIVLGRSIGLSDVMLAFKHKKNHNHDSDELGHYFTGVDYLGCFFKIYLSCYQEKHIHRHLWDTEQACGLWQEIPNMKWNLNDDNLDNQSDELKSWLIGVFGIE